ncbi:MAG: ABC transporter permease subunit [Sedimentisphaerales bacterium]|nr:ABC transporter permease subunit [Sedimentisphaerales bacterium]
MKQSVIRLLNWMNQWNPIDLAGPIVDKELRVAASRKRYYFLRTLYISILTLFLAGVWFSHVGLGPVRAGALRAADMSSAGRMAIITIVSFQFLTLPVLAVVLLSNSVSDEIRQGTLAVLMTTPINSLQIVVGKLFGRLLVLALLLAISFPLLSIVRVFGGVPWTFVLAGVFLTFTTSLLGGSLSLLASVSIRQAYRSTLLVILVLALLFLTVVALHTWTAAGSPPQWLKEMSGLLEFLNPYAIFYGISSTLLPGGGSNPSMPAWFGHCLFIVLVSCGIALLATIRLRKVMLTEAFGGERFGFRRWFRLDRKTFIEHRPLRTVRGECIVWKEMQRIRPRTFAPFFILGGALLIVYSPAAFLMDRFLFTKTFHSWFAGVLVLVGLVRTASLAAGSVASEREGRCWPLLLTTLLDERQIIRGKTAAIFIDTAPLWIWLFVHTIVFIALDVLDPLAIFALLLTIPPGILFFIGLGMYFGTRLKTVTGAVAITFAAPIGMSFLFPLLGFANPIVCAAWSMQLTTENVLSDPFGLVFLGGFAAAPIIVYATLGLVFLWQARCRVRRDVFGLGQADVTGPRG